MSMTPHPQQRDEGEREALRDVISIWRERAEYRLNAAKRRGSAEDHAIAKTFATAANEAEHIVEAYGPAGFTRRRDQGETRAALAANATDTTAGDGWIACSERMPDNDDIMLVTGDTKHRVMWTAYWLNGHWESMGQRLMGITHWRPLPAPPTAGSEGE